MLKIKLVVSTLIIYLSLSLNAMASTTVLVVGDSLSAAYNMSPEQGWVTLLEKKLKNQFHDAKVINISVSGDTTKNGLVRLPNALKSYQPNIVILGLGGNDGLRGLPLMMIKSNLEKLITLSQSQSQVLLLGMKLPSNYGDRYRNAFHEIYHELSQEYEVKFIPFILEDIALDRSLMNRDGIHPNEKAQPKIVEVVWPVLAPMITQ